MEVFGLPVLAFLSAFVAVLYQRAFGVGVLSDGWVLLEIDRQGSVRLLSSSFPITPSRTPIFSWRCFGS
jgi:hypothetical protein